MQLFLLKLLTVLSFSLLVSCDAKKCMEEFSKGDLYIFGMFHTGDSARIAIGKDIELLYTYAMPKLIRDLNIRNDKTWKLGYLLYHGECNYTDEENWISKVYLLHISRGLNKNNTIAILLNDNSLLKEISKVIDQNTPVFIFEKNVFPAISNMNHRSIIPVYPLFNEIMLVQRVLLNFNFRAIQIISLDHDSDAFVNNTVMPFLTKDQNLCISYIRFQNEIMYRNLTDLFNQSVEGQIYLVLGSRNNTVKFFQQIEISNLSTHNVWFVTSTWSHFLDTFNINNKIIFQGLIRPDTDANANSILTKYFKVAENSSVSLLNTTKRLNEFEKLSIASNFHVLSNVLYHISREIGNISSIQDMPLSNLSVSKIRQNNIENFNPISSNVSQLVYNPQLNVSEKINIFNYEMNTWIAQLPIAPRIVDKCVKPTCGIGFKAVYKESTVNSDVVRKFGHACKKCDSGNKHDDSCDIQHYYRFIRYTSKYALIIYSVMGVGVLTALIVGVIFWCFRNTPYVKASNQKMSLIQLFLHLLLFVAPIMFIGKPSHEMCTARPITFGILFTFIMAITMTKTQKLVFIFQARLRMSKKRMYMSQTMEVSLILLMLLVQSCIAALSYFMNPSRVVVIHSPSEEKYVMKCNTDEEFLIQLCFGFLLALMCMFQAFKARHLPENFNETKLIFVTMILCVISVIVCLPLRFYLKHRPEKIMADILLLVIMNYILLVTMYGHKCWIIILKPERNTTFAFKENLQVHNLRSVYSNNVIMNHRDSASSDMISVDLRSTTVRSSTDYLSPKPQKKM